RDHSLHILWCDRRQVTELWLFQCRGWGRYDRVLVARLDGRPVDIAHEGGHVCDWIRTKFDVICMLVHVESEDRNAAPDTFGVVGRIDVEQAAIARHIDEEYPTGITPEGFRERDELGSPLTNRSEIAGNYH